LILFLQVDYLPTLSMSPPAIQVGILLSTVNHNDFSLLIVMFCRLWLVFNKHFLLTYPYLQFLYTSSATVNNCYKIWQK